MDNMQNNAYIDSKHNILNSIQPSIFWLQLPQPQPIQGLMASAIEEKYWEDNDLQFVDNAYPTESQTQRDENENKSEFLDRSCFHDSTRDNILSSMTDKTFRNAMKMVSTINGKINRELGDQFPICQSTVYYTIKEKAMAARNEIPVIVVPASHSSLITTQNGNAFLHGQRLRNHCTLEVF